MTESSVGGKWLNIGPVKIGRLVVHVNLLILLCVLSSVGMFASLGFWQLDRANEKRTLAADLQQRALADPVPLLFEETQSGLPHMTRVTLQGEFQNEIPFLVLFQFFQGQAGFELIVPFKPSDNGPLLLVSRGWIAPGAGGGLPQIPPVSGLQTISAQVYQPDIDIPPAEVTDDQWPVRLARLNIEQAGRLLGEPVYPQVLRLESGQPGVLVRHWSAPRISMRSHLAYTVQWFGLTLLVLIASLLYASNAIELIRSRQTKN
jgi:cytochrome oxidase assembly protein ShyY1